MSREFVWVGNCYSHSALEEIAAGWQQGREEITRLLGNVLAEVAKTGYAVCSAEAMDSCNDFPISEALRMAADLERSVVAVKAYLRPFEEVVRRAIAAHAKRGGEG